MEVLITENQENCQRYCYNYTMTMFIYLTKYHDMEREIQEEIDHLNKSKLTRICKQM